MNTLKSSSDLTCVQTSSRSVQRVQRCPTYPLELYCPRTATNPVISALFILFSTHSNVTCAKRLSHPSNLRNCNSWQSQSSKDISRNSYLHILWCLIFKLSKIRHTNWNRKILMEKPSRRLVFFSYFCFFYHYFYLTTNHITTSNVDYKNIKFFA